MQQPARVESPDCGYTAPIPTRSRRTKAAVAGVAMVSAGALALTPVVATPKLPEVQVASSTANVGLSAFQNPLEVWGETFNNLVGTIATGRYQYVLEGATGPNPEWVLTYQEPLIETVSATVEDLSATLGRPDVQAGLTAMFTNVANPERWLDALAGIPGHAELAASSLQAATETLTEALTSLALYRVGEDGERLPSVLQTAFEFLAQGEVFKAYSEINYWFLVDGLSNTRTDLLDAFKIPGDFLTDLGLEPLGRILGNSDTGNDGLLGRTVIGNFGRAVLAPPITAIFQAVEIVDTVGKALQNPDGPDFETAVSELINAPAKLTNAFLSGYVPGPLMDFSLGAGRGQAFPGIFSPTGPFDFLFNQVPAEIIRGITPPPAPATTAPAEAPSTLAQLVSGSPTDNPVNRKFIPVSLDDDALTTDADAEVPAEEAPAVKVPAEETPAVEAPAEEAPVVDPVAEETPAPAEEPIVDEGTAGETADEAKALTTRDRLKQVREQSAEKRAERAEKARATVDRVRSNIRKGLGISDKSKSSDADTKGAGASDSDSKSDSGSESKSDSKSKSKDSGSDSGSDD